LATSESAAAAADLKEFRLSFLTSFVLYDPVWFLIALTILSFTVFYNGIKFFFFNTWGTVIKKTMSNLHMNSFFPRNSDKDIS
jgi:hypothetical protein